MAPLLQHFDIVGTGGYLPREVITAESLDARLGLPPGWTERHTGVRRRHRRAPDETATTLACHAARAAVADAGLNLRDIDLIFDASTCQQQPIPGNAALINEALGPEVRGTASMDVHASCLSFLAAVAMANAVLGCGLHRRVLVVSAETPLDGVNWADPASACLMGEGAAAAVLQRRVNPVALGYQFETFGEHAHVCEVAGGGHRLSPFALTPENTDRYRFAMDGPRLHRIASKELPRLVRSVLNQTGDAIGHLHVVPHQASGPAVSLLSRRLGITGSRLHSSLADHGNLVAAGIPYALHRARSTLVRGDRVLLVGTAAGYAQAALVFTY